MSASRSEKIRVGYGGEFEEIDVDIEAGDIAPYDPDEKLRVVGHDHVRLDAVDKVTGRAKYTSDQHPEGMLYGRILRSPHANADAVEVDLSAARALPGVKAAISFPEVFGAKSLRFAGQGVAAIAAESEEQAEEALRAIRVKYDVLPFCVTKEAAMAATAPQVGRGDQENVVPARRRRRRRGPSEEEVVAAIEAAPHQIEGTFDTQVQNHSCLETHGVVCQWEGDDLLCYCSTQSTFGTRGELQRSTEARNVRVICEYIGGGFGSKFSAGREGVAGALLARQAGRPVRLMLDRREEHTSVGNRPDSHQVLRMGVAADGKIQGYHAQVWGTAGTGGGGAGAQNDVIYDLGLVHKQEYAVRTNCGNARAQRAPGFPQGVFALEGMMDMAAEKVGMDPIEFRKKNDFHPVRMQEYDLARQLSGWDERRNASPGTAPAGSGAESDLRRGMGVASSLWFAAGGRRAGVRVRIHKNGTVEVRNGAQDIGTGTRTLLGMCAAEELGIDLADVQVFIGDTNDPPGPGSGGSTTAPTLTPVARLAAHRAKEELLAAVAEARGWDAAQLDLKGGRVVRKDGAELGAEVSFRQACAHIVDDPIEVLESRRRNYQGLAGTNAGVQIAEVEVDTGTGSVRVLEVTAVADAGKIINPRLARSQVSGAVIQGVSYALFERRVMDRVEGRMVNADFENYRILGAVDCPEIQVALLDVYMGHNNTHVMGLGEPPTVATAAAIANAVYNATGARVTSLPITPAKVLDALARKEARG